MSNPYDLRIDPRDLEAMIEAGVSGVRFACSNRLTWGEPKMPTSRKWSFHRRSKFEAVRQRKAAARQEAEERARREVAWPCWAGEVCPKCRCPDPQIVGQGGRAASCGDCGHIWEPDPRPWRND